MSTSSPSSASSLSEDWAAFSLSKVSTIDLLELTCDPSVFPASDLHLCEAFVRFAERNTAVLQSPISKSAIFAAVRLSSPFCLSVLWDFRWIEPADGISCPWFWSEMIIQIPTAALKSNSRGVVTWRRFTTPQKDATLRTIADEVSEVLADSKPYLYTGAGWGSWKLPALVLT